MTHRQELAGLKLCNTVCVAFMALIATDQIPIPKDMTYLFAFLVMVINDRASWLPGLLDQPDDALSDEEKAPKLKG